MSLDLTIPDSSPIDKLWEHANPRRGEEAHEYATLFYKSYPIGKKLTMREFDEWALRHGLMEGELVNHTDKYYKYALRDKRNKLRQQINTAASHPRINPPFQINCQVEKKNKVYRVEAIIDEILYARFIKIIDDMLAREERKMIYLIESTNWRIKPAGEYYAAEKALSEIRQLREIIKVTLKYAAKNMEMLRAIKEESDRLKLQAQKQTAAIEYDYLRPAGTQTHSAEPEIIDFP